MLPEKPEKEPEIARAEYDNGLWLNNIIAKTRAILLRLPIQRIKRNDIYAKISYHCISSEVPFSHYTTTLMAIENNI